MIKNFNYRVFIVCCFVLYLNFLFVYCGGGGGGNVNNEELYKLLGVSKTATTREIRKAFKKIALIKHPDKNQDDPNANENFIKINRAYEILKDDELRKKYDTYGEEGIHGDQNQGRNYQSWNFYNQNFGIYDDDPEIITLSRSDFLQSVEGSSDIWFINFYSAQCGHCHDLAPTWRELAKELDGVIRIGAVNCLDDWQLCNEHQIQMFPSLIIYPKKEHYRDQQTLDKLLKFALKYTKGEAIVLNEKNFDKKINENTNKMWFISYCMEEGLFDDEHNCLDESILQKLSIMMSNLINVATINCNYEKILCSKLKPTFTNIFYKNINELNEQIKLEQLTYKDIANKLLTYLPDLQMLDREKFEVALKSLKDKTSKSWLIQFVFNYQENSDIELRKLPSLLDDDIHAGRVDCNQLKDECQRYQITKYPTFVLLKRKNLYEHHYGRQSAPDLVSFARENSLTNVKTLQSSDFPTILEDKKPAFIDFFAPWCPPCMNLLPNFRKAAKTSGKIANFGTVDCTVNQQLCERYNIRAYPSTILFNNSMPHQFHGHHTAEDLNDFIQDILNPTVFILNYDSFHKLVSSRESGKMWLVDFFANWCGPCQQMAPEWRKLSKRMSGIAFVGQVDCVTEGRLCQEQGITSYPHIRLYPADSKGSTHYHVYNNNWWRDANSFHQWANQYIPSKAKALDHSNFELLVLNSKEPWLIDFYAPWCGHCVQFAPIFETIATKLEGKVNCGKVNCQEQGVLCQRLNLRGYPTVKYYKEKSNDYYGEDIGNYDMNNVLNFVNSKLSANSKQPKHTEF